MNGRIYNPLLGRFLSADTIIQFPGNLQSYNRYAYVHNNPLTFADPSGHVLALGAFIGGSIDFAAQVFIEGKAVRDVNYASVFISAAAGATGAGLGGVVANFSRSLTRSAIKQVAIRAAGNMAIGAGVGCAQTAATNAFSDKSEQKSLSAGTLWGAGGGAFGSLVGDVVEAAANKIGSAIVTTIADTCVEPNALQTKLIQSGTLQVTNTVGGDLSRVAAGSGEVAGAVVPDLVSRVIENAESESPTEEPAPAQESDPQEEEPAPVEPIELPDAIIPWKKK